MADWMPDGRHILALVSRAGTVHATSFDAVSGEARAVTAGTMTIAAFTVDQSGQRMAVLQREPHNPGDIFCYDLMGNLTAKPRTVNAAAVVLNQPDHMGPPLLAVGNAGVTVPPRGSVTRTFRKPWPNPKLWGPESPTLYQFVVFDQ